MRIGIQKKMALSFSAFLIVVSTATLWGIIFYATQFVRENIQKQQFAMTELIASSIDDKLGTPLAAITNLGQAVPPDAFADPKKAQAFIDSVSAFRSFFDRGMTLFDAGMSPIAATPNIAGTLDIKGVQLEPFLRTVEKNDFPDISNPYLTSRNEDPFIVLATPIRDRQNRLKGFLVGSINLTKDYFLEELMLHKIGKKGYMYIFNTDRTMLLHPDKSRIMKKDIPPGRNKLLDKAIDEGFEGSGETINTRGMHQIASFKRLKTVDWILASAFPQDEAYAPLKRLRTYLVVMGIALTFISIVMIWLLTSRVVANLNQFTEQVLHIRDNPESSQVIRIKSNDEVGVLADSFNQLLTGLSAKNRVLVEQKELLEKRTAELEEAVATVKVLGGIIPICAWCKKIRNDSGYWEGLEKYLNEHSEADFSHGICPECLEKVAREM